MFSILKIIVLGLLCSSTVWADDDWGDHHRGHGHGHHHRHHHEGYPQYRREIVYMPAPVVEYVPVAPRYYAPPPPPPVSYYGYDQRSPHGLMGSMVGGAVGYEVGRGDPLAAGIGAAAGAFIGNGRY